jgi:copper homeostasis protein (lipoprotein)
MIQPRENNTMERNPLRTPATAAPFLLLGIALLGSACSRPAQSPEPAAPAVTPAAAQPPVAAIESGTGTTMAQPGVQPTGATADARALTGTYSGTLPCADCPGIDETLVLTADGGFVLTDTYRERPGTANVVEGSWSLEEDGKRIRLDPGSKDATDKFYEVDGDGLRVLDGEGQRLPAGLPHRLKKDA